MADGDDDPVAWFQRLAHSGPQVGIEGARGHAAQRLVLDGDLRLIEILVGEIAPAPLSVIAVAQRAVAHRGVADEEEHGVHVATRRAGLGTRHQCLGYGVGRIVDHLVHISNGIRQVVEALSQR